MREREHRFRREKPGGGAGPGFNADQGASPPLPAPPAGLVARDILFLAGLYQARFETRGGSRPREAGIVFSGTPAGAGPRVPRPYGSARAPSKRAIDMELAKNALAGQRLRTDLYGAVIFNSIQRQAEGFRNKPENVCVRPVKIKAFSKGLYRLQGIPEFLAPGLFLRLFCKSLLCRLV